MEILCTMNIICVMYQSVNITLLEEHILLKLWKSIQAKYAGEIISFPFNLSCTGQISFIIVHNNKDGK
jgi:hypothetical protein